MQTAVKPYPSCRWTHGAIDAALSLRSEVPARQRLDAHISVRLNPIAYTIVAEPQPQKIKPANTVDAQFSVYFQVAAAWLDGHVDWSTYDHLTDPAITTMLAAHIDVEKDNHVVVAGADSALTRLDAHAEGAGRRLNVAAPSHARRSPQADTHPRIDRHLHH
jgi:2-methylcitrate dehydratase PrpD